MNKKPDQSEVLAAATRLEDIRVEIGNTMRASQTVVRANKSALKVKLDLLRRDLADAETVYSECLTRYVAAKQSPAKKPAPKK